MKKYVFLTKDDKTNVVPKQTLSRDALKQLKKQGVKIHHIEVEAENEQDAIEKLHKDNDENLKALGEFSGHMLYAVFLALFMLVVVCFFT